MKQRLQPNKVRIHGEDFIATRIATTQEDNHHGISEIWDLTDSTGHTIHRGLVRWTDAADGGWGFWRGEGRRRIRIETRDIVWLVVDDNMRRWLAHNGMSPCLFDVVSIVAKSELGIETLEERRRDHLDFHECGVVSLRRALERAYLEGMQR